MKENVYYWKYSEKANLTDSFLSLYSFKEHNYTNSISYQML